MRRLVVTAFAVVAVLCLTRPALAQAGKYSLDGEHEDKGSYRGDCTIEKSNATWEVVENVRYSSGARERRAGKG